MQPRKLRIVSLLLLMLSSRSSGAQSQTTFTLQEAQRLALGNYQLIGAMREQFDQARYTRREVGSVLFPTVSVETVVTRNLVSAAFEFGGRTIDVLPANDYNIALVVSQPIYAGLRDLKARRQADLGVAVARKSFEITVQDVLLEATDAYYRVLAAQDNVEISRRAVEVAEETLRNAESLYRAGESVETSVLRARVAHSDAQRELLEAGNLLEIAKGRLKLFTGIEDDIAVTRPSRPQAMGQTLPDLIQVGLRNRKELQSLDLQERIAELEIEKARGQYMPSVHAEATYIQRRSSFPSDNLGAIAVVASWTVFDGGRVGAQVANARSQLREIDQRMELLVAQTREEIRTAFLNVETRAASADMLTAQVDFARRNAEESSRAFRVGEATDLDVLTANSTLTRSERQLTVATYELDLAIYELERAVGTFAAETAAASLGEDE